MFHLHFHARNIKHGYLEGPFVLEDSLAGLRKSSSQEGELKESESELNIAHYKHVSLTPIALITNLQLAAFFFMLWREPHWVS